MLEPGERAIVMIPMSIDLYVGMLALLEMGAVAVFVDPWIGRRQIAAFAAFAEPRAWLGVGKSHLLRLFDPRLRGIPIAVTTGWHLGPWPARCSLADLEDAAGSDGGPPGRARRPRPHYLHHRLLGRAQGGQSHPPLPARPARRPRRRVPGRRRGRRDDDVPRLRAQQSGGRGPVRRAGDGLPPRRSGGRRPRPRPDAAAWRDHLHRLAAVLRSPRRRDGAPAGERPSLRRLLTGGAPVSDAQLRTWRLAFPETEILVAYGSTEAEPVAHLTAEERLAAMNPARPLAPGYCAGRPIGRMRAKVVRIDPGAIALGAEGWAAWELPAGEIGELIVSGDHVCRDYYRNPRAVSENKIADGEAVWHRMGDTGSFDTEGRFWLAGRVHSTIRRAGVLVHPQLVEQAACGEDPRIHRIAAVGVPDPDLGELVVLVVETEEEGIEGEIAARVAAAGLSRTRSSSPRSRSPSIPVTTARSTTESSACGCGSLRSRAESQASSAEAGDPGSEACRSRPEASSSGSEACRSRLEACSSRAEL